MTGTGSPGDSTFKFSKRLSDAEKTLGILGQAIEDHKELQDERHTDTKHLIRRLEFWLISIMAGILVALFKLYFLK